MHKPPPPHPPHKKKSSSYSLLKFVKLTSQLLHSLVVHPLPRIILDLPVVVLVVISESSCLFEKQLCIPLGFCVMA